LKCKGITVYRYGSKKEQVLNITPVEEKILGEEPVTAESEFSGGCPAAQCTY
jgi:ribonucleoside-diphosphate reductase alpha chain